MQFLRLMTLFVVLQTEWNWKIPFKTVLWRFQLASQRNTLETQRSFQWWYSISKEILVFYSSGLYWSTGTIPLFFFFCLSLLSVLDMAAKGRQLTCLVGRINLYMTVTWASWWRSKINFNQRSSSYLSWLKTFERMTERNARASQKWLCKEMNII